MANDQPIRVVVIGAGYAGMLATVRMSGKLKSEIQRGNVAITLVNAAEDFVERPRLHQFAANLAIARKPIADILKGTGVSFLRGVVTDIDVPRSMIVVEAGTGEERIPFHNLLYALGSTIDQESVRGVREHAYVLTPSGPNSAIALRAILPELEANGRGARILVCGGGATGIEAAAEFASSFPTFDVKLVTRGEFGSFTNKTVADYMRHSLGRLGVTIQDHTSIAAVEKDHALTASGDSVPFDVCLWAGGFTVPQLAREAGMAVNDRGQVLIDPFMRSISHPRIYAVGDAAAPVEMPGAAVRMAGITAVFMGAHGADCLSAEIQGKTQQPFSFAYLGQGIALGKNNAIGFNNYPADKPNLPYFTGRLGYEGREFFVRLLGALPTLERRWPGITFWLGKGRYAAAKRRRQAAVLLTPQRPSSASPYREHGL